MEFIKHFLKKLGKVILLILIHFLAVIPAFSLAVLLVVIISMISPSDGMGFLFFSITSGIIFVGLILSLIYVRTRGLWTNGYFWLYFLVIPWFIVFIFDISTYATVMTKYNDLKEKVEQNLGIANVRDIYQVPEEENSSHLLKFYKKIPKENRDKVYKLMKFLDFLNPLPDTIENIDNIISPYTALLDSFSKYDYFQYVWPGDYAESLATIPIPDMMNLLNTGKAGIIDAKLEVKRKNYRRASKKLLKVWHLRNLISSEPYMINSMVATVLGNTLNYAFEGGIKEGWALRDEIIPVMDKIYEDIERSDPLLPSRPEIIKDKIKKIPSLNYELHFIWKYIEKFSKGTPLLQKIKLIPWYLSPNLKGMPRMVIILCDIRPFAYFNYGTMLNFINVFVPETFESWQDYLAYYFYEEGQKELKDICHEMDKNPIPYGVVSMFIPNFPKVILREVSFLAKVRILKSAVEIENIKKKNGKYPESFEDIRIDPFTGKKLVYKLTKKVYMIYSVGENLKDNEGKKDDIVFEKVDD